MPELREQIAYTVQQAAEQIGLSVDVIRAAIRRGDLIAKYPTARPVVLRTELIAWLEAAPSERRAS